MHDKKTLTLLILTVLTLLLPGVVTAQTAGGSGNTFGVFAGVTDFDRGGTNPTLGLELDHDLDGPWSVGGVAEYSSSGYRGSNSTLLLGTLNYRPPETPRLKLTGGTGVEFNRYGDDIRLRLGIGYDVVTGPVTLTPRFAFDFGNSRENLVLGATAYFRF